MLSSNFGGSSLAKLSTFMCGVAASLILSAIPVMASAAPPDLWTSAQNSTISDRFLAADDARDRRDFPLAEQRYRALIAETEGELRIEARFRLAIMLDSLGNQSAAATELRAILLEKPDAQAIRVILARMLAQSGEGEAARREFREAEQAGLPPEVQVIVRQFVAALRSSKPVGASLSLAFVTDGNVNRATGSDTVDTIIAPFQLSKDAQAQSSTGLTTAGQIYARAPLYKGVKLLARVSGQGDLYDKSNFNDIRGGGQIGLELVTLKDRVAPSIGRSYRWFGGDRYATTDTLSLSWRHKASGKALIEGTVAVGNANYAQNDGLDGRVYDFALRYERALSQKHGANITLSAQRQAANDPGYATASGGLDALYWRQAGKLTLFGSFGLNYLEADSRQLLFPRRRKDWLVSAAAGASLPQSQIAGFTPLLRGTYLRNSSTVTLYDYSRIRIEFGLSRSF
jgi:outer membrane protein